ncbi:hypothetical protein GR160_02810 [Flavobacterium sp. Sd200]|uniref:peptidoglycan-binding domain-containing protein n=1 Tax=Flavobacterium sp. Sd200 TaxID=2692211 RepID=UPI00136C86D7|nr:peptidoglycan-binding domain-containing protein [Flavobacterium sp. Sd200]MXN90144.1 hypothetical protein [Flavobacterium sp. Sd200]
MKGVKTQYLVIGGLGLTAIAYGLLKKKSVPVENIEPITTQPTTPVATTPTLNNSLLLKKGSTGNEVKQLQTLLGVTADGIFGSQTEAALKAKKGVTQITLAAYRTTADINNSALTVGTRVMANRTNGVAVNSVISLANNTFSPGSYATTFNYGSEIGTIVSVSNPAKTSYVVEYSGWFTAWIPTKYWVNAADVAKI